MKVESFQVQRFRLKLETVYARAQRLGRARACFWDGLEGNTEHGGVPALLKKVTRRELVTCNDYYSSVPVNVKLKVSFNFVDLSDQLLRSSYASSGRQDTQWAGWDLFQEYTWIFIRLILSAGKKLGW